MLTVPETKHCYLYVNSSAFDSISISKGSTSVTQNTDEPYIYDLGILNPDETVSVLVSIEDSEYGYIDFYPYYVNDDALKEGYEILSRGKLDVTSFSDTRITGTVEAAKDCVFYTSIPYDKGWTVKIDGKEIDKDDYISLAEAYLSFNLPAGKHTVELSFRQRGLAEGAAISAVTLVILIALWVYTSRRKKKAALLPAPEPTDPVVTSEEPTELDGLTDEAQETEEAESAEAVDEVEKIEEIEEAELTEEAENAAEIDEPEDKTEE